MGYFEDEEKEKELKEMKEKIEKLEEEKADKPPIKQSGLVIHGYDKNGNWV